MNRFSSFFAMTWSLLAFGCAHEDMPPAPGEVLPTARCVSPEVGKVSVAALIEDVVDVERLASPEPTEFRRRLASSTNPATDPTDSATWYGDDQGYLRLHGDEKVVLESNAPGAITRFWTANPSGRIKVYIDGETTATIDVPMADLFENGRSPFEADFFYVSARGYNLIYPITWAHSVLVTVSSERLYYTFEYREYANDVAVESFPAAPSLGLSCALRRVRDRFSREPGDPAEVATFSLDSADPSQAAVLAAAGSGSSVRWLRLKLDTDEREVLARTALAIDVDGVRTVEVPLASILVPMRDAAAVHAFALDSSGSEWILRLPMPFAREMRIALESRGGLRVRAVLDVAVGPMEVTGDTYRLFVTTMGPSDYDVSRFPGEVLVAHVDGSGRFVGMVYEVGNPDPLTGWWGEGDPTVTVDGEAPMRGTGSEDHFLFAHCSTERFASRFSGQTRANADDNGGLVTLYRFYSTDDYSFAASFELSFELLAWATGHGPQVVMPVSSAVFFYGTPTTRLQGGAGSEAIFEPISLPLEFVNPGTGFVTCG